MNILSARHFLVADYIVPVYSAGGGVISISGGPQKRSWPAGAAYLRECGVHRVDNFLVAQLDEHTSVDAVFSDLARGHLMVTAEDLPSAYRAARAVDSFFFLALGHSVDLQRRMLKLTEVKSVPNQGWTRQRLSRAVVDDAHWVSAEWLSYGLYSGHIVQRNEMAQLCAFMAKAYANDSLCEALPHLGYSRHLLNGYMTASYYYHHYRHERAAMSDEWRLRAYFESRELFELAFTAAFKALERILDVSQIKKHDISRALGRLPTGVSAGDTYTRRHEVFSKRLKQASYSEMVAHFLDMRNAAAAHANPTPPKHLILSEDSVLELQLFVSEICSRLLAPLGRGELPPGAVQCATGNIGNTKPGT
jgi:hypothetical protein